VRHPQALLFLLAGLLPASASGQGGLAGAPPLTVDFGRAPVGSWAEYAIKVDGKSSLKARWALLGRAPTGNTLELTMEGPGAASAKVGGKVVTRMVLQPDPIGSGKPIRELVVQMGDREPVDVPLDLKGLPGQKFQNPDPKKLVERVAIAVAAGTFATGRYQDLLPDSTVDSWLSAEVPPLGVVKIVSTPRPGAVGPGGKPLPPVTMELLAHGKDARPAITRPARPFRDPAAASKE
jgi:hypothetical protein